MAANHLLLITSSRGCAHRSTSERLASHQDMHQVITLDELVRFNSQGTTAV